MPRIIRISTSGDFDRVDKILTRMQKKLPEMTREAMRKWGKILVRDTKQAAIDADIKPWTGTLFSTGIRWEQGKKSDVGFMFMRQYGLALDHMKPHFVNIHRRRTRLLAWARQAENVGIKRKAHMVSTLRMKGRTKFGRRYQLSKFSIYVKPHPFIDNGYRRARPKLTAILKIKINKGVEQS